MMQEVFTPFQKKVYRAVQKVPRGKVITYKRIAQLLGAPKACRAVGQALKKNPHLVTIPCHRVVRADGSVGGYVLGTRKKIELLKKEGIKMSKFKGIWHISTLVHK